MEMDQNNYFAALLGLKLVEQQFESSEWQHRVAAEAAREPWRQRFARQVQRLKLLASEPWPAWEHHGR
jgi:hypothetical protein